MLTPAISFGSWVALRRPLGALHDPDEEVGREEGPEDHHLGDDEKQHPEQRGSTREERLASGGPWCSCSCWPWRDGGGLHQAGLHRLGARTRCARPACSVAVCDALDQLVGHPLRAALGQRRDHDLGDVEELHGVHRRRVGVGVADHARRPRSPASSSDAEQRLQALARGLDGAPVAAVLRHDDDEAPRPLARRAPSGARRARAPATVWLATTSVTSNGRPSRARSTTTCLTGSPVSFSSASIRSRRSQPEVAARQRRDDDLVDPVRRRSRPCAALSGSPSPTSPAPSMPSSRMNASARSTRTCAESRTASS